MHVTATEATQDSALAVAQKVRLGYREKLIFADISFTIPQHQLTAIMGTSGCGKTTVLRMLSGQLLPQSGRCLVFGEDLVAISKKALYEVRRKMSILFQAGALFSDLDVFDNVAFPLREHNQTADYHFVRSRTLKALEAVGLRGVKTFMPTDLSGGMMRRVAFARAIVTEPQLLLLDEPFTGQDPIAKGVMKKIIADLKSRCTCVLVSHDIPETLELADNLIIMRAGHIIAAGPKKQVLADDSSMVKQFLSGSPDGPVSFHMPTNLSLEDDIAHV